MKKEINKSSLIKKIACLIIAIGISGLNPIFILTAEAASSSFSAAQTVANVADSTVPAITLSGGSAVVNGTVPDFNLTGGVTEVSATSTLALVASSSLANNEYFILTDNATSADAVCFYFDTNNGISDDTGTAAQCKAADGFAGGVELDVSSAGTAAAVATVAHNAINGVVDELLVTSTDNADGTLTLAQDTAGTAGNIATNTNYLAEGVANAGVTLQSFSGGVNGVAATDTQTITSALAASATDSSITIDGNMIALGSSALTAAQVADEIVYALTTAATGTSYVADGAYTVATSGADVIFTRTATGAGGNANIVEADTTYTQTSAVAATDTITIPAGLSANANDYSVAIDGNTIDLGTSALTAAEVASAIASALTTAATGTSYVANGAYTVSTSSADVVFSRTNGTNGAITRGDASYGSVAQVVTFTPSSVVSGETFNIVINSSTYSFTSTAATAQNVVEGLQPLVNANSAVSCTEDNVKVTCTAATAGTSFSYSVSVSAPSGGGGGIVSSAFCSIVEYDTWQDACVNGWQYRNVISSSPSGCRLSTVQENSRKRECGQQTSITETITEQTQEEAMTISSSELYINEAQMIFKAEVDEIISILGIERNQEGEKLSQDTLVNKLKIYLDGLEIGQQNALTNFITYGSVATEKLGWGERAGVVNSFQSAFGKIPETESDWQDIVKIANGRWPNQRNSETENNANSAFRKIYLRDSDRSNPHDDAAVTVIAYGLRPAKRNLDSEKAAIKIFKAIYGYNPTSASAWDIVRAIAYSGATR